MSGQSGLASETDFVRGGANEFKAQNRNTEPADNDFLFSTRIKKAPVAKKSKKKKPAPTEVKKSEEEAELDEMVDRMRAPKQIELLSFQKLSVGTLLLGAVRSVHKKDIVVSLPNSMTGFVRQSEISDVLSADAVVPSALYSVGQLVRCVVRELQTGKRKRIELSLRPSKVNAKQKLGCFVAGSTALAAVKSVEDHGYVMSFGLPGITGFLPFADAPTPQPAAADGGAGAGSTGSTYAVGAQLECVVRSVVARASTVRLSAVPAEVAAALRRSGDGLTLSSLLPGTAVRCRIGAVLDGGLFVSFLSVFRGVVDCFHLSTPALPGWQEKYSVGSRHLARITVVDPESKTVRLSMAPHMLAASSPAFNYAIGDLVHTARIERVDPGIGLFISMPATPAPAPAPAAAKADASPTAASGAGTAAGGAPDADEEKESKSDSEGGDEGSDSGSDDEGSGSGSDDEEAGEGKSGDSSEEEEAAADEARVYGYIHISRVSDKRVDKLGGKYKVGRSLRCRVVGLNSVDALIALTAKKSALDAQVLRYADVSVGMVLIVQVQSVMEPGGGAGGASTEGGLRVAIADGVSGFIPFLHLSDTKVRKITSKFREGMKLKARVLLSQPNRRKILLTYKKTLVRSELPPLSRFDQLTAGETVAHGFVTAVRPYGVLVTFYDNMHGLLPTGTLTREGVEDIASSFRVGQVLKVRVQTFDSRKRRLILSLNTTDVATASSRNATAQKAKALSTLLSTFPLGSTTGGTIVASTPQHLILQLPTAAAATAEKKGKKKSKKKGKKKGAEDEGEDASALIPYALLPVAHLSDHAELCQRLQQRLTVGQTVSDALVLNTTYVKASELPAEASAAAAAAASASASASGKVRVLLLSLKPSLLCAAAASALPSSLADVLPGAALSGYVASVASFGVFVRFLGDTNALAPRAALSPGFVSDPALLFAPGQSVTATVTSVDVETQRCIVDLKPTGNDSFLPSLLTSQSMLPPPAADKGDGDGSEDGSGSDSDGSDGEEEENKAFAALAGHTVGQAVTATVTAVRDYGTVFELPDGAMGFATTQQMKGSSVDEDTEGAVPLRVLLVDPEQGLLHLTARPQLVGATLGSVAGGSGSHGVAAAAAAEAEEPQRRKKKRKGKSAKQKAADAPAPPSLSVAVGDIVTATVECLKEKSLALVSLPLALTPEQRQQQLNAAAAAAAPAKGRKRPRGSSSSSAAASVKPSGTGVVFGCVALRDWNGELPGASAVRAGQKLRAVVTALPSESFPLLLSVLPPKARASKGKGSSSGADDPNALPAASSLSKDALAVGSTITAVVRSIRGAAAAVCDVARGNTAKGRRITARLHAFDTLRLTAAAAAAAAGKGKGKRKRKGGKKGSDAAATAVGADSLECGLSSLSAGDRLTASIVAVSKKGSSSSGKKELVLHLSTADAAVTAATQPLPSWETLAPGGVHTGVVDCVTADGAWVFLSRTLRGFVHCTQISGDLSQLNGPLPAAGAAAAAATNGSSSSSSGKKGKGESKGSDSDESGSDSDGSDSGSEEEAEAEVEVRLSAPVCPPGWHASVLPGSLVTVTVLAVDAESEALSLTMRPLADSGFALPAPAGAKRRRGKKGKAAEAEAGKDAVLQTGVGSVLIGRLCPYVPRNGNPSAIATLVQLSGDGAVGRLCVTDLADSDGEWCDQPLRGEFMPGRFVRVCVVSSEGGRLTLSAKPSVLQAATSAQPIPAPASVTDGDIVNGYVASVAKGKGVFVRLSRGQSARVTFSNLSDGFLRDPAATFPAGKLVRGKVLNVDEASGRVEMSLKRSVVEGGKASGSGSNVTLASLRVGQNVKGYVRRVSTYGVFIGVEGTSLSGMCHISEAADTFIKDLTKAYAPDDYVKARVLAVDVAKKRLSLGLKPSYFEGDDSSSEEEESESESESESEGEGSEGESESEDEGVLEEAAGDDSSDDDAEWAALRKQAMGGGGGDSSGEESADGSGSGSEEEAAGSGSGSGSEEEAGSGSEGESEEGSGSEGESEEGSGSESGSESGTEEEESGSGSEGESGSESESEAEEAAIAMPDAGFAFGDADSDSGSGSDSDEEEEEEETAQSSASRSRRKAAERKRSEAELAAREKALVSGTAQPRTADEFERLLLSSPNSSFLWIKYMAYQLSLTEFDQARAIAERALRTIAFRDEGEKLNVWMAYLNLEHRYGGPEAVAKLLARAQQQNDPKTLLLRLLSVYGETGSVGDGKALIATLTKRFKGSAKVWVQAALFLAPLDMSAARELLPRALQCLPKRKHIATVSKFAQLEMRHGQAERGRTLFQGLLSASPKRVDLWNVFIDVEIAAAAAAEEAEAEGEASAAGDGWQRVRELFQRALSLKLSSKKMKGLLKKFLAFELKHGDAQQQQAVRQLATEYVNSRSA